MNKMRVLWFSNTPANSTELLDIGLIGGGWLKSLDLALQRKVELHVAFYYPKRDESFKYLETTYYPISTKGWKYKALIKRVWQEFIDGQDLPKYQEIINRVKPDIIHIHGTENPFGRILKYTDIPIVVSIQGTSTVCFHKFLSGFSYKDLRSTFNFFSKNLRSVFVQKSFFNIYQEFKKAALREQRNLAPVKYIIGRTDWDRRITGILAKGRTYYHGDEMMREAFYNRIWKTPKSGKLILHTTIGNSTYKGFETICEALYELNQFGDFETEWRVAGVSLGDEIVNITRRKLKSKFPKKGLLLMGRLDEQLLLEKLCEANIFISPSHIENSPNSLCEAMLIGMPCIATFAGGTGSLLNNGEDGILIQDGDPWSMAGAIIELFRNEELAEHYGHKAREKALLRHDRERIVTELLLTYSKIIRDNL